MIIHCGKPTRMDTRWIGPIELAWAGTYYWIASGPVPLLVARELYDHPLGRSPLRVNGDARCRPPLGSAVAWYTAIGERVYPAQDDPNLRPMSALVADIWQRYRELLVFHDQRWELGATPYIECYHIDGDDAFALFESVLRNHGLDRTSRPEWWE